MKILKNIIKICVNKYLYLCRYSAKVGPSVDFGLDSAEIKVNGAGFDVAGSQS